VIHKEEDASGAYCLEEEFDDYGRDEYLASAGSHLEEIAVAVFGCDSLERASHGKLTGTKEAKEFRVSEMGAVFSLMKRGSSLKRRFRERVMKSVLILKSVRRSFSKLNK
jgi:hypothetical protein